MILNDVKIIGNLISEPELRYTPNGTQVANLSVGINETYRVDDEQRQITTFVDVQVWGPSAQNFANHQKDYGRRSRPRRRLPQLR
jgi:single-strand DNA-binding protein